jgi:LuxR family maltose regulon positive regulatory protein
LLHSPQPYATESVLTALINNLADIQQDFAIILDDYHLIRAEPIHAGIAYLLEHLPLRMHLVIATRSEPPIPLAHFRGQGKMLEIGADDLRFTVQEAGGLLKAMQGLELTAGNQLSRERTEGWAAGLGMAALSLA